MKTFQMDNNPNILEFTNYERIDEEEFFNSVLYRLKKNPNVEIGEKQVGPSEDYYNCKLQNLPFVLFFDIDYGTSIKSDSLEVIKNLIEYFN